jgi:hypothetical protein
MNSTFTPIRRADSRTRQFWPLHLKSKIYEVWRSRRLKKSKNWRSQRFEVLETQPESATRIESRGLLTWICPSGTRGLVYWAQLIKEVDKYKDSKMTWSRRKKTLIRIRLGSL